jgi:hypothetical protein
MHQETPIRSWTSGARNGRAVQKLCADPALAVMHLDPLVPVTDPA